MHCRDWQFNGINFILIAEELMKRIIFCLLSATLSSIASLPLIAAPTQPIANYQILFSPERQRGLLRSSSL